MASRRRWSVSVIPTIGCIILIIVYLGPMVLAVLSSLKDQSKIFDFSINSFWPLSGASYVSALGSLWTPLLNSLIISASATVLTMILASGASYALARMESGRRRRVASAFLGVILLLQLIPQASAVIPNYTVLVVAHLANSLLGVIVFDAALMMPLAILVLRPHFAAVPIELEDAARVDGAGIWTIFLRIVMPLSRNGLLVVGVIVFALIWGEFIYAVTFLGTNSLLPVSVVLLNQVGQYSTSWNSVLAVAVIATIPVLAIFIVSQRQLREGISAGAIR
jgi:multiple sugar transport system permease protein